MSDSEYQVRRPATTERDAWERLWQGYLVFYKSSLAADITDELWRRIHDPDHEIECRIAVSRDDALLGLVHFFPHAHTWYQARVCYLNDLFVEPAIRGGGIGEALIEAVVTEGRKHGWAEIYWHTQVENQVARGLYDKITGGTDGFVNYTIDLSS